MSRAETLANLINLIRNGKKLGENIVVDESNLPQSTEDVAWQRNKTLATIQDRKINPGKVKERSLDDTDPAI